MTLDELGFQMLQRSRDGTVRYSRRSHEYLTVWLNVRTDGTADLTWEFALGQYLVDRGFVVSAQDELSLLLFPREELHGTADPAWAAGALEQVATRLASLDLAAGT